MIVSGQDIFYGVDMISRLPADTAKENAETDIMHDLCTALISSSGQDYRLHRFPSNTDSNELTRGWERDTLAEDEFSFEIMRGPQRGNEYVKLSLMENKETRFVLSLNLFDKDKRLTNIARSHSLQVVLQGRSREGFSTMFPYSVPYIEGEVRQIITWAQDIS